MRLSGLVVVLACGVLASCATKTLAPSHTDRHYLRVALSPDPVEQPILTGPPQTGGMYSGRVVLKAGEMMNSHSTNTHEELLVFLQGKATVLLGRETLTLSAGEVLYIPPQTLHELYNDGPEELRYIYTVAPAGP